MAISREAYFLVLLISSLMLLTYLILCVIVSERDALVVVICIHQNTSNSFNENCIQHFYSMAVYMHLD